MPRIKVTKKRMFDAAEGQLKIDEESVDNVMIISTNYNSHEKSPNTLNPQILPKFQVPIMFPIKSNIQPKNGSNDDGVNSKLSSDFQPLDLSIRHISSADQSDVIQLPVLTAASTSTETLPPLITDSTSVLNFTFDNLTSIENKSSPIHSNYDENQLEASDGGELSDDKADQRKEDDYVPCFECGKTLRRGSLREHMDRHTGQGKFSCESCGKTFSRSSALEKHRLTHTGEKPFACPICDKSYRQKVHLNEHMRSHTGERPYLCPICNFSLASKSLLNRHVRTHSDKRDYVCEFCDKTFKRREGLLAHQATHDTEKRHTCEHCQRAFSTSRALKCHQVVHSDERPYPCHLCEKAFKTAKLLRNHIATHSDLKPFSCPTCDKTFRTKVYLDNHSQVHIKDRFFECGACHREFHHKSSLEKHMRKTHGQKCEFTISYKTNSSYCLDDRPPSCSAASSSEEEENIARNDETIY